LAQKFWIIAHSAIMPNVQIRAKQAQVTRGTTVTRTSQPHHIS